MVKKFLTGLIIGIILISSIPVSASAEFSDVKQSDWYYETVSAMTDKGLFVGKGNNRFYPNDTMTIAEFITVIVRVVYPNEDITATAGQKWWQGTYEVAVEKGLVLESEFVSSGSGKIGYGTKVTQTIDLDQPIKRQIMAMISIRALNALGETEIKAFRDSFIPDYSSVGTYYREYVRKAYGAGIIVGNEKGYFNPQHTLTRAEASTVLYRIIEPSARVKVDFNSPIADTLQGSIIIYEGQEKLRRFAKEGDTVIKADGTQVVLKKGPHGIVGEGQGVAPDLGVKLTENAMYSEVVRAKNSEGGMNFTGATSYRDGSGTPVMNGSYYVNEITGEGHWSNEWNVISQKPTTNGTFNYQLSSDKNWMWLESQNDWCALYAQDIADSGISVILQANGL